MAVWTTKLTATRLAVTVEHGENRDRVAGPLLHRGGGRPTLGSRAAKGYLVRNWDAQVDPIDFTCTGGTPTTTNKGCGYAMFNVFKGLRLYGVNTLPGIGRPAGPGPIPADDWYADYVDNLLANQHNPTNPTGGDWSSLLHPRWAGRAATPTRRESPRWPS